jgi:uncharacterized membrane protein
MKVVKWIGLVGLILTLVATIVMMWIAALDTGNNDQLTDAGLVLYVQGFVFLIMAAVGWLAMDGD